jgi:pimeloyl-ACP methyl ester carboxylesterase
MAGMNSGQRQSLLHPDRCEVDPDGAVPKRLVGTVHDRKTYADRGWGTVGEGSYHDFLLWLEEQLHPAQPNPVFWRDYYQAEATMSAPPQAGEIPKLFRGVRMGMKGQPFNAQKPFDPVMTDDLLARTKFLFPVYAVGYNWLDDNRRAGSLLNRRIEQIVAENNKGQYSCQQVVLITHSMGGLVARACAQLPGMSERIAGIVHGVMPAVGAAVAYRRCKVGMRDEDYAASLVIGQSGQDVTAVFAQAPGALQLLPSQQYSAQWLQVVHADSRLAGSWPSPEQNDPYESIYLRKDRWWGLVDEAWLSPQGGQPITWDVFAYNVNKAKNFHAQLSGQYHPYSFVYYGADKKQKSFERVTWRMKRGIVPDSRGPSADDVMAMGDGRLREAGNSTSYVGGEMRVMPSYGGTMPHIYESSYWELHCELQDGAGDGTVPESSGSAPLRTGGGAVQQQFALTGFSHEPAYHDRTAQMATLYGITKIVGKAKIAQ